MLTQHAVLDTPQCAVKLLSRQCVSRTVFADFAFPDATASARMRIDAVNVSKPT